MLADAADWENHRKSRRNPSNGASLSSGEPDPPLADVLAGCRRGDRAAQQRLYERFSRKVYRVLVRIVGEDDAADIAQQSFLQVFRKIGQFAGTGRLERWILRVAVNEAYQHLRQTTPHRGRPLPGQLPGRVADSSRQAEHQELLTTALARLEPELRAVFVLREIEQLSYAQIAEVLSVPEGTVGSRLNRARRLLRKHLVELGWEP